MRGHRRIARLCTLAVAAVVAGRAAAVHAACPLALDGDADTVARIDAALAAFPEDRGVCVALRVTCDGDNGAITLELHDELDRAAHRTFASAEGAAAFLVSWSRRALPLDGVPPGATPTIAVEPPRDPWHGEFQFAYIQPVDDGQALTTATAGLIRRDGIWRYGGDLQLLAAPSHGDRAIPVLWVSSDLEALHGIELTWRERLRVHSELVAGASYSTMLAMSDQPGMRVLAVHAGLRGSAGVRLGSAIWLDAGATWDFARAGSIQQDPVVDPLMAPVNPFGHPLRIEIGLRWAP